jgi:pyrophosphate--fructose-6-phosphate 1-phosphotransferase
MDPRLEPDSLDRLRRAYEPRVPAVLREEPPAAAFVEERATVTGADATRIRELFPRTSGRPIVRLTRGGGIARPLRLGAVLSGGQAPGGHNVITGLHDALRGAHPDSRLFGFLGGPRGILRGSHRELDAAVLAPFRNSGGFDLLGSGRDKIETPDQLAASRRACEALGLDGLVVIGGDDSNTNAALLAEHLLAAGSAVAVVGVPKTIDGDLKGGPIETSFGFDTATKVYSDSIGNICRDAKSSGKYWHFIKLMGRSASHVTLECALRTHPNVTLIGEEVRERRWTLADVVDRLASAVRDRAAAGRAHGVCLVPEGLIEFIPEVRDLIRDLDRILAGESEHEQESFVARALAPARAAVFASLPTDVRRQLLLDRDAHGNVQVSRIDTEELLVAKVAERIRGWQADGSFAGRFDVQTHFLGYEGRCAAPSNFDADYTHTLGRLAVSLVAARRTGYLCAVRHLARPVDEWEPIGVPLTSLMQLELRRGAERAVVAKALVRTDGPAFRAFAAAREGWLLDDDYRYPGALQYFGPPEVCDRANLTLALEYP